MPRARSPIARRSSFTLEARIGARASPRPAGQRANRRHTNRGAPIALRLSPRYLRVRLLFHACVLRAGNPPARLPKTRQRIFAWLSRVTGKLGQVPRRSFGQRSRDRRPGPHTPIRKTFRAPRTRR